MDPLILILRWIHILCGSLWLGYAVFITFMLAPALEDAGPGAAGVMPALGRRGIMTILPLLALATVLSGLGLFWRLAGGHAEEFLKTSHGMTLGVSGVLAIVAYLIGITVIRPSMLKTVTLMQSLGEASAEVRGERMAEIARLRSRGASAGRLNTVLLLLSASGMAVARYL